MEYINTVFAAVLIGMFILLFYGPWQTFLADWARQRIFLARDLIFDMAVEGKLDFNSGEYRRLRLTLETLIRFAHRVTWTRIVMMCLLPRKYLSNEENEFFSSINNIEDPEIQKELTAHVYSAVKAIMLMIVFRSLPLILMSIFLLVVRRINKLLKNSVYDFCLTIFSVIQKDAELNDKNPA